MRIAASLAAPPRCGICGGGCDWRRPACARCAAALGAVEPVRRALPGFDAVVGAGPYAGVLRDLVAGLKFGRRHALAPLAAEALARAIADPPEGAVVVPVPPAPRRWRRRGFDSADWVAGALARELGLPISRCLVRPSGRRQVGRARAERLARPPQVRCADPPPRGALLVDDVLTTGATLAASARALRGAGSVEIAAAVVAIAAPGGRGAPRTPAPTGPRPGDH